MKSVRKQWRFVWRTDSNEGSPWRTECEVGDWLRSDDAVHLDRWTNALIPIESLLFETTAIICEVEEPPIGCWWTSGSLHKTPIEAQKRGESLGYVIKKSRPSGEATTWCMSILKELETGANPIAPSTKSKELLALCNSLRAINIRQRGVCFGSLHAREPPSSNIRKRAVQE